jgi:formate dehydrogenase subunit gamma
VTDASGDSPEPGSPAPKAAASAELPRFDVVERLVHWSLAIMVLTLIVTGATLYFPILALHVGHRGLIEEIHVTTGLCLVIPLGAGLAGPWRKRLVVDLRRFDRWGEADFDWFRRSDRRLGLPRDKFNGGQKIEAAFLGAALAAALVTGVIMRYAPSSWVTFATGATLVHDALFFAIVVAVVAHVGFALSRPDQLKSMFTGRISRSWAHAHAQGWLAEVEARDAVAPDKEPIEAVLPGPDTEPGPPA